MGDVLRFPPPAILEANERLHARRAAGAAAPERREPERLAPPAVLRDDLGTVREMREHPEDYRALNSPTALRLEGFPPNRHHGSWQTEVEHCGRREPFADALARYVTAVTWVELTNAARLAALLWAAAVLKRHQAEEGVLEEMRALAEFVRDQYSVELRDAPVGDPLTARTWCVERCRNYRALPRDWRTVWDT